MREVESLLQEAQAMAASHGHQLGLFRHVDLRTYVAECERCFGTVIVTTNPSVEEHKIEGMPVATDCPAA